MVGVPSGATAIFQVVGARVPPAGEVPAKYQEVVATVNCIVNERNELGGGTQLISFLHCAQRTQHPGNADACSSSNLTPIRRRFPPRMCPMTFGVAMCVPLVDACVQNILRGGRKY